MIQRSSCLRILGGTLIPKTGVRYFGSEAASSLQEASNCSEELADIDWNNLGFGLMKTDYMYVMKCGKEEEFKEGQISPFANIELSPSAGVLNYGQGLFEGLKAYRREDGGLFLFRPQENAIRMQIGSERMCMPSPSIHQFIHSVKQTALANRRWIPPPGKGSLYIRPLLIGSGPVLGLAPASEYTFLVYASPVGNYYKDGTAAINLYVEDVYHRAARGGAGGVKSITNYAPVLKAMGRAKNRGFSDVLYLSSVDKRNIEEVSSCNVFILQVICLYGFYCTPAMYVHNFVTGYYKELLTTFKGNVISTPPTNGTVLEGITRKSIMDIAVDLGYQVEERSIPIEELMGADEVFCTGTAVGVVTVGSVTYKGNRIEYKMSTELVSQKLHSRLIGIQKGDIEDDRGWIVEIN